MVRTVSLCPDLPEDRFLPMLETCAKIFDEHTKWATDNRTYSKQKAHEGLYRSIRESHPEIPSTILQTTRDCALEASKRCNRGEWKTPTKNTLSAKCMQRPTPSSMRQFPALPPQSARRAGCRQSAKMEGMRPCRCGRPHGLAASRRPSAGGN